MPSQRNSSAARGGKRGAPAAPGRPGPDSYWILSGKPLHVLAFVLPLVVFYEWGSAVYLTGGDGHIAQTIKARKLLVQFLDLFGSTGLFLPALAILTVLLIWHILNRDSWRLRPSVVLGMWVESAAWTMPLLVLLSVLRRASVSLVASADGGTLAAMPWQARLTISVGAGLYEEMLFRMILITLAHLVLADLMKVPKGLAAGLSVLVSALAFALYHDAATVNGEVDWGRFMFYAAAGVHLGAVYVLRGLGLAVGTHALYDVCVLVMLPSP